MSQIIEIPNFLACLKFRFCRTVTENSIYTAIIVFTHVGSLTYAIIVVFHERSMLVLLGGSRVLVFVFCFST